MKNGFTIKQLIRAKGYTQRSFAEKLGISPSTLNGYISSEREPGLDTLVQIAKLLDFSLDDLLDTALAQNTTDILSEQEKGLLDSFRRLNTINKQSVCSYADFLSLKSTQL